MSIERISDILAGASAVGIAWVVVSVLIRRSRKAPDWQPRTDHARRTKGEPAPTYAQLVAEIRLTQAALAKAEEIAANLRHQCDGLIRENARLRAGALPQLTPLAVDEDVTRPYIPDFEGREQPWTEER